MGALWQPERQTARIRNGVVQSVAGGAATVRVDGGTDVTGVSWYGPAPVAGQGVLLLEQGGSLLLLGNASALVVEVEELRSRVAAMEARLGDG